MVTASTLVIDSIPFGKAFGNSSPPGASLCNNKPTVVELMDDCFDLRGTTDEISVSDDESLEGVEESDVMLPSSDFGDAPRACISLPPLKVKIPTPSSIRRVSLDNHRACSSRQANTHAAFVTPPRFAAEGRQDVKFFVKPPCAGAQSVTPVPMDATLQGRGVYPFSPPAAHGRHEGMLEERVGRALSSPQEFFVALRHFADTMKRSEFSRREVVLGRRRLRHIYRELDGQDDLLSGEPWGRSVTYQAARKELAASVYGELFRRLRSLRAESECDAHDLNCR